MKKKIIIISSIVLVLIIIIAIASSGGSGPEYVTAQVELGSVEQTVDATGSVASSQAIELNFKTTGRIASTNVKVGNPVIKGQTLSTLESGALISKVADAQSALLEAQANLEQVLSGSTPEDIRVSEITLAQKKQDLVSAQNNLSNLELTKETELKNLKNTAIIKLNNELIVAEGSLEIIDNTLDYKDAQDTLGVLDSPSVSLALDSQINAITSVDNTKLASADITENSTDAQVMAAISAVGVALSDVRECLSDVFDVLENTITSSKLSQAELDGLITDIQSEQSNISTSKNNLQTVETNWTNKQVYYDDQITKAQDAVKAAEDAIDLAQAQLALKQADPQGYEITAARAKVAKAEANLALAQANLGDTIIRAPVNGQIIEIHHEVGEQTSLASPVIKMIGESQLEIEVDIPESDIAKIELGQSAVITLDSFGDEQIFSGTVTFINPAETVIQDVVYYQVKVQFDDGKENVKPGMTANVTIKTLNKNNVLRLPLRAVKQKNGNKVVEILVDKKIQEKEVTTGLKGDDYIEIISGVVAGEEVITFIKNSK